MPRFTGSSEHSLDEKGRFVVPARFRERLGTGFVLTVLLPDPCLALYPAVTWEAYCDSLTAAPDKDDDYRNYVRELLAHTHEGMTCDTQGRLLIPSDLRAYAGLDREAKAIGSLSHVEIWSPARFGQLKVEHAKAAAIASRLGFY